MVSTAYSWLDKPHSLSNRDKLAVRFTTVSGVSLPGLHLRELCFPLGTSRIAFSSDERKYAFQLSRRQPTIKKWMTYRPLELCPHCLCRWGAVPHGLLLASATLCSIRRRPKQLIVSDSAHLLHSISCAQRTSVAASASASASSSWPAFRRAALRFVKSTALFGATPRASEYFSMASSHFSDLNSSCVGEKWLSYLLSTRHSE